MTDPSGYLQRQFDTAWRLSEYHLQGLETTECLWRPAPVGPHVHRQADKGWRADWPEREDYVAGPPSIAWLTWHMGFWWSMVQDHSFGAATLTPEKVAWPGTAEATIDWLHQLRTQWRELFTTLSPGELESCEHARWPFRDRPFGDIVAWVNLELMKNAAEIGYARFLYASRSQD